MTEVQSQQAIGQLTASIAKVEPYLEIDEFNDYCDNLYTCVAYLEKVKKRIKDNLIIDADFENASESKSNKE